MVTVVTFFAPLGRLFYFFNYLRAFKYDVFGILFCVFFLAPAFPLTATAF